MSEVRSQKSEVRRAAVVYFQSPVVVAILTNVRSQNSELRIAHFKYILYWRQGDVKLSASTQIIFVIIFNPRPRAVNQRRAEEENKEVLTEY